MLSMSAFQCQTFGFQKTNLSWSLSEIKVKAESEDFILGAPRGIEIAF